MTNKSGYIYVLTHPSDPNLYKIGVTILEPKKRLAQHNRDLTKAAGCLVKETGQKWELKEHHAVPDPYLAERAFWAATSFSVIPYRNGVEVERMSWKEVQKGLDAAKKAGSRLEQPSDPLPDWVYAYTASMKRRLEGRGITLLGYVKSMCSGKSSFRCSNGHEWQTRSAFETLVQTYNLENTDEFFKRNLKTAVNDTREMLIYIPEEAMPTLRYTAGQYYRAFIGDHPYKKLGAGEKLPEPFETLLAVDTSAEVNETKALSLTFFHRIFQNLKVAIEGSMSAEIGTNRFYTHSCCSLKAS